MFRRSVLFPSPGLKMETASFSVTLASTYQPFHTATSPKRISSASTFCCESLALRRLVQIETDMIMTVPGQRGEIWESKRYGWLAGPTAREMRQQCRKRQVVDAQNFVWTRQSPDRGVGHEDGWLCTAPATTAGRIDRQTVYVG